MAATADVTGPEVHHEAGPADAHAHPSDLKYIYIALILAVFTAIEVSTYFVDFGKAHIPVLLVLMTTKFAMVALYFMHLKFDAHLFRRMFVAGLAFAVGVYCIMLTALRFW